MDESHANVAPMSSPSLRRSLITEESVYGTILVSGMIVASGVHEASPVETFLTVIGTVVVFWAAHVYAGTVAGHGVIEGDQTTLPAALRNALRRSIGFLISAVPPCVVLLLGALRIVPDQLALWIALWLGVIILGVLGYSAFAMRHSPWPYRVLGGLGTAAFGIAMIVLKAVIH